MNRPNPLECTNCKRGLATKRCDSCARGICPACRDPRATGDHCKKHRVRR